MRARRAGHIVNVSPLGGLAAFGATDYHHATKFPVEGLSDSLAVESAPLGIKVTIVEPAAFRTNRSGLSARPRGRGEHPCRPLRTTAPAAAVGQAPLRRRRDRLESLEAAVDAWRDVMLSADYPEEPLPTA